MTITLFISLLTLGSALCSIVTEAIKNAYKNAGKECSPNLIALVDAVVVGGLGTATAYMLMGIPWTINNIICLVLMIVVIWLGAMCGWDKVIQTISQISDLPKVKESEDDDAKLS